MALVVDFLRQGIWGSLTGGWYFDPGRGIFTNTFHLYMWIFFFCLPFSMYMYLPSPRSVVLLTYSCIILVIFILVKAVNISLHKLFDCIDMIVDIVDDDDVLDENQEDSATVASAEDILSQGNDVASRSKLAESSSTISDEGASSGSPSQSCCETDQKENRVVEEALEEEEEEDVSNECLCPLIGVKSASNQNDNLVTKNPGSMQQNLSTSTPFQNINPVTAIKSRSNSEASGIDLAWISSQKIECWVKEDIPNSLTELPKYPHEEGIFDIDGSKGDSAENYVKPDQAKPQCEDGGSYPTSSGGDIRGAIPLVRTGLEGHSRYSGSSSTTSLGKMKGDQMWSPLIKGTDTYSPSTVGCAFPPSPHLRRTTTSPPPLLSRRYGLRMPSTNMLREDPNGLKLFLDVLNKPTTPEDEVQLKKLISANMNQFEQFSPALEVNLLTSCSRPTLPEHLATCISNDGLSRRQLLEPICQNLLDDKPSETSHVNIPSEDNGDEIEIVMDHSDSTDAATFQRIENSILFGETTPQTSTEVIDTASSHEIPPKVNKYYLLHLPFLKRTMKIWLDRLQLLEILDQDANIWMSLISIGLAVIVSVLGFLVLDHNFYKDISVLIFCCVLSSCHFSLLKSVQPDASSPHHGFNIITAFSRPIYFSICCALILILEAVAKTDTSGFRLYVDHLWMSLSVVKLLLDLLYGFILCLPIIFTWGLLPQPTTALMFLCEQVDIHVFGGNATSSLLSSLYCLARSILAVLIVFGFAYAALLESFHSVDVQEIFFSLFCSLCIVLSYHLSRSSGNPSATLSIMNKYLMTVFSEDCSAEVAQLDSSDGDADNPNVAKQRDIVSDRLACDALLSLPVIVLVILLHQSQVFSAAFPILDVVLWIVTVLSGILLHYILPQLRNQTPWNWFTEPFLVAHEQNQFEVRSSTKVMRWEKFLLLAGVMEKYILYPLIFLSAVNHDRQVVLPMFGVYGGSLVMSITLIKCLRCVFSDSSTHFATLAITVLFFQYNPDGYLNVLKKDLTFSSSFLMNYFLTTIFMLKITELYLKFQFILTYIAPHQITWGSAFHAFTHPLALPHSAMLVLQAVTSTLLSSPLIPVLGSSIFICSYSRPVKFWERDYITRRSESSNTRLASQVEPAADEDNLDSIFYEHLTQSLQESLAGDLMLGRWGSVQQGDCFVLASDNINCLVHIIEIGNGICTFQLRGLEFRGTYCQQREVEAITEDVEDDPGCLCFQPGRLPHMVGVNTSLNQSCLAWEVISAKYVLEGYTISDNSAQSMFQVYDLRKVLVSYFVKSIIYYAVQSSKLEDWLANEIILYATKTDEHHVDQDHRFHRRIDEDYSRYFSGVTFLSFCKVNQGWIKFCYQARESPLPCCPKEVIFLCYSLSLLGRRALSGVMNKNNSDVSLELFLSGLHGLFKGDLRLSNAEDEWVFTDMALLRQVVVPAVRMSLKLHQDHFLSPDEYEESSVLFQAISQHEENLVIAHEVDPVWRKSVLAGAPSLLTLRHIVNEGIDEYKVIMLNKRFLSFRVVKLNRECVRGLWAGQQQELIFMRNRNSERGSIQAAKQALRNMINSSCDQPIGYPIYVSSLTTSYSNSNLGVTSVLGMSVSLEQARLCMRNCWSRLTGKCVCTNSAAQCGNRSSDVSVRGACRHRSKQCQRPVDSHPAPEDQNTIEMQPVQLFMGNSVST